MTSQKSLKNNVNKNDFKRSLIGSLPFPLIAFAVLLIELAFPVFQYVTSEDFLMVKEHTEISMYLASSSTFYYSFEALPIGMIICGMLTALKSFYFMLSKKQVNVLLSLGIKRKTMVTNRLLSGVITLFTAVLVPILLIYITNILSFGYHPYQTSLFLYFTALLLVCGLVGYTLVSSMIMVSGNIFEAALSALGLSVIPFLVFATGSSLAFDFLKGYVTTIDTSSIMYIFTPWTLAMMPVESSYTYSEDLYYYDQIAPQTILRPLQVEIPKGFEVDWDFIFPVAIWFVVSLVLIGVTYYLFNRRKAEHANSLGKFSVSRAVFGTCAFMGVCYVGTEWFGYQVTFSALLVLILAVAAIAYFLVQLILTRKPKVALKSMKWYGVLACVLIAVAIVINTGLLGQYNKIPDKADIKSVTIEAYELNGFKHWVYPWNVNENFVESSTDESKEVFIELYELLKNEKVTGTKEDAITSIRFGSRDNNGEMEYRCFYIYSEETYMKYIQLVYGSDYFDAILKNYLVDDIPENTENDSTGYLKRFNWAYTDADMIIERDDEADCITDVSGLCEALYKDLSEMTVDELFRNNNKPIGVLTRLNNEYIATYTDMSYYPSSNTGTIVYDDYKISEEPEQLHSITEGIPVYEDMTNTVSFLENAGYEIVTESYKVKEIFYTDSKMSLSEAQYGFAKANKKDYRGYGDYDSLIWIYDSPCFDTRDFEYYCNDFATYFIDEPVTEYELLQRIYKDAGNPLVSVKDTAKAQEIADKSVSQYMTMGDNGRYVYVVYENNVMAWYYLPEANLSVIE